MTTVRTSKLVSPLRLDCGIQIPNRICKAAMTEGLAERSGAPGEQLNNLYRRWSGGGAGLLISGNVMVDGRFLERGGNMVLERCRIQKKPHTLDAWRALAEAGTSAGNQFWLQLNHPGRQCARLVNSQPLSPSDVQLELLSNFAKPRAMTSDDINEVIERFASTAALAREAGFTGVQIHSAHGYLGSQFLSPVTNRRTDDWGGSLENRSRFLLAVVDAVRARVGDDFAVSVKLNSADFQKGGFTLEECLQVVSWLGERKVDLLEISGGTYENLVFMDTSADGRTCMPESTRKREAFFLEYAETISAASSIPLMITGGFRTLATMIEALDEGATSLIGVARPFCVAPDFPAELLRGDIDAIPDHEQALALGRGFLGTASSSKTVRAINNQGQAGWYYHQIRRLARGSEPNEALGVLNAFCRHMVSDAMILMQSSIGRSKASADGKF